MAVTLEMLASGQVWEVCFQLAGPWHYAERRDESHVWYATARRGVEPEHRLRWSLSGLLDCVLQEQHGLNDQDILKGIVRVCRRRLPQLLAQDKPEDQVLTTDDFAVFVPAEPASPIERVEREIEDLLFDLPDAAQELRQVAAKTPRTLSLSLPEPAEWVIQEPLLRNELGYPALVEFYDGYRELQAALSEFPPSAAVAFGPYFQRVSRLGLRALEAVWRPETRSMTIGFRPNETGAAGR